MLMPKIDLTTGEGKARNEMRFVFFLCACVALVVALPFVVGWLSASSGTEYLGFPYNTDDHMVYAAWMRQAMEWRFFMDNRFTTDAQPGLTVHLFFFFLGLIAKVLGITLAANLARVGLSALFIWLLYRFIATLKPDIFTTKLALTLAVLGGGVGFLVWHNFGVAIVRPGNASISSLMLGRLPSDVWQPEGFVFPSMLTNALFMASLCLIITVFQSILEARAGWKPVLGGAIALGVLMNIHSYDVLMIGLVLAGFLTACLSRGDVSLPWVSRSLVICSGIILPALWFVHVLQSDPVFQARAATETFSPNFRQVIFGYLFLITGGLVGIATRASEDVDRRKRRIVGIALYSGIMLSLFLAASTHTDGFFLTLPAWGVCFAGTLIALFLVSDPNPSLNLVIAWAFVGTIALYFPALFQRKLAMGLSIPWAILAAYGFGHLLKKQERSARNLATILILIVLSASSFRWLYREIDLIRTNVSNTTVHPVYLTPDVRRMVAYLNNQTGRNVLIAVPGRASTAADSSTGQTLVDTFMTPIIPDLNPIMTGLTGVYTVAGHWSETPQYGKRRGELEHLFFSEGTVEEKRAELAQLGAKYVVAPVPEAFPNAKLFDFRRVGTMVVEGTQFRLIQIPKG